MESLKPLKVIGALALLCLAIFFAFPDGRLNTRQFVYSLTQPPFGGMTDPSTFTPKIQPIVHEDRTFLLALQNQDGGVNLSTGEGMHTVRAVAKAALDANESTKLAIAAIYLCGGLSSVTNLKFPITPELTANKREYAEISLKVFQAGEKLEPQNAFWPFLSASAEDRLGNGGAMRESLIRASKCEYYDHHFADEFHLRLNNSPAPSSAFNVTILQASITLNQLPTHTSVVRKLIGTTPPEQNIADRLVTVKIGRLMAESQDTHITQLVGRSIVSIGTGLNPTGSSQPSKAYTPAELDNFAKTKNINSEGIFTAAQTATNQPTVFRGDPTFNKVFDQGPLLTFLPFVVIACFIPIIAINFWSHRWCQKPIIRPIRYLLIMPITALLVFAGSVERNFHPEVAILVVIFSFPLAYLTFTEKFVPFIHTTVVVIATVMFLPEGSVPRLAFETASVSALAILAWWQNRQPDHKVSKAAATIFTVAGAAFFAQWIFRNYNSPPSFNFNPAIILVFLSYAIATTHPDKMFGRRQATNTAVLGLTFLLLACVASLASAQFMWNASSEETNRVMVSSAQTRQIFADAKAKANSAASPGVKIEDK